AGAFGAAGAGAAVAVGVAAAADVAEAAGAEVVALGAGVTFADSHPTNERAARVARKTPSDHCLKDCEVCISSFLKFNLSEPAFVGSETARKNSWIIIGG